MPFRNIIIKSSFAFEVVVVTVLLKIACRFKWRDVLGSIAITNLRVL
jgi:hypothetical protein